MDATGEELNAFETVMWRIESDPALRTPAMACLELDAVPDPGRPAAVHEAAVAGGRPTRSPTSASTCGATGSRPAAAGRSSWRGCRSST